VRDLEGTIPDNPDDLRVHRGSARGAKMTYARTDDFTTETQRTRRRKVNIRRLRRFRCEVRPGLRSKGTVLLGTMSLSPHPSENLKHNLRNLSNLRILTSSPCSLCLCGEIIRFGHLCASAVELSPEQNLHAE
jgi:hypothetical protein